MQHKFSPTNKIINIFNISMSLYIISKLFGFVKLIKIISLHKNDRDQQPERRLPQGGQQLPQTSTLSASGLKQKLEHGSAQSFIEICLRLRRVLLTTVQGRTDQRLSEMVDSTVSSLLRVRCTRMRGISAPQDSERAGLARWSRLSWWWSSPGTARLARAGTVYTDRTQSHTVTVVTVLPKFIFSGKMYFLLLSLMICQVQVCLCLSVLAPAPAAAPAISA